MFKTWEVLVVICYPLLRDRLIAECFQLICKHRVKLGGQNLHWHGNCFYFAFLQERRMGSGDAVD